MSSEPVHRNKSAGNRKECKMSKSSLYNDTPFLPFQIHETQRDIDLDIPKEDISLLRELGQRYAEIAALPIQEKNRQLWEDVNNLQPGRPAVWINEICWHEMNVDDELTICSKSPIGRRIESELRKTLYQWKHMPGDMVVDDIFYSPLILENSGIGVEVSASVLEVDSENTIASHSFHDVIKDEDDLEKITYPVIKHNEKRSKDFFELYGMIFSGIMSVQSRGCTGFWFAPWDDIAMLRGAQNLLLDLAMRPEFMHKFITKLTDCYIEALRQFETMNLLARNDINVRIGSGGYGYVGGMPDVGDPQNVKPINMWGSATPQIFAAVSPQMHDEFGIQYEEKWLNLFGLTYYGCCEPLDGKIDCLSKINNLRKISISPWANVERAAEQMRDKYVVSLKPSPACFQGTSFDAAAIKSGLYEQMSKLKDCSVEIIMKDISTVGYKPQRLWEWAKITKEVLDSLY